MIDLLEKMINTDQIEGKQSVLAHGESVFRKLNEIIEFLEGGVFPDMKEPVWLKEHKDLFLKNLYDKKTLFLYTVFHDCGKPSCYTKDEYG